MFLQIQKFLLLVVAIASAVGMMAIVNSSENHLQQVGTTPYFLIILLLGSITGIAMLRGMYIEARENEDNESSQEDEAPP